MKKQTIFLVLVVLVAVITGCQFRPADQSTTGYRSVSPQQLKALLEREKPFLLDVHVPNQGHLAGTDARIPYTEVGNRVAELPADRSAPLVVYCMSGRMSEIAAKELVRLGYRNVLNVDGGMVAWQAAGYEVLPER